MEVYGPDAAHIEERRVAKEGTDDLHNRRALLGDGSAPGAVAAADAPVMPAGLPFQVLHLHSCFTTWMVLHLGYRSHTGISAV